MTILEDAREAATTDRLYDGPTLKRIIAGILDQWIPCSDRLPESMTMKRWQLPDHLKLVLFRNDVAYFVGFFFRGTWYNGNYNDALTNSGWVDDVIEWQTLPPPPAPTKE